MASSNDSSKGEAQISDAELAQISEAFTQIAKGEKTAQALESNLTSLEKKIDDLLASFEESERMKVEQPERSSSKPENPSEEKKSDTSGEKS